LAFLAVGSNARGAVAPYVTSPPVPMATNFATVELHGATISLTKVDGSPWDIGPAPSPADVKDLAKALALIDPVAPVLAILARPTAQALGKPDPFGTAKLVVSGTDSTSFKLKKIQDSYTPAWEGVRWEHVSLDGNTRIQVTLADKDLVNDDPIGTFELTATDMKAAIAEGKVHQVKVADQTNNQALFAAISVFAE